MQGVLACTVGESPAALPGIWKFRESKILPCPLFGSGCGHGTTYVRTVTLYTASKLPSYPGIWRPFLSHPPRADNQEGTPLLSPEHPYPAPGMPSPQDPVSSARAESALSLLLRRVAIS